MHSRIYGLEGLEELPPFPNFPVITSVHVLYRDGGVEIQKDGYAQKVYMSSSDHNKYTPFRKFRAEQSVW